MEDEEEEDDAEELKVPEFRANKNGP